MSRSWAEIEKQKLFLHQLKLDEARDQARAEAAERARKDSAATEAAGIEWLREREERKILQVPEGTEKCTGCQQYHCMLENRREGRVICPNCGCINGVIFDDDVWADNEHRGDDGEAVTTAAYPGAVDADEMDLERAFADMEYPEPEGGGEEEAGEPREPLLDPSDFAGALETVWWETDETDGKAHRLSDEARARKRATLNLSQNQLARKLRDGKTCVERLAHIAGLAPTVVITALELFRRLYIQLAQSPLPVAEQTRVSRVDIWCAVVVHIASIQHHQPVSLKELNPYVKTLRVRWNQTLRKGLEFLRHDYFSCWRISAAFLARFVRHLRLPPSTLQGCRYVLSLLRQRLDSDAAVVDPTRAVGLADLAAQIVHVDWEFDSFSGAMTNNYMSQLLQLAEARKQREALARRAQAQDEVVIPRVKETRRDPLCLAIGVVYLVSRLCDLRKACTQKKLYTASGVCANTISKTHKFIRDTIAEQLDEARLSRIVTGCEVFEVTME